MARYAERVDLERMFSAQRVNDWADKDRDGVVSAAEAESLEMALNAAQAVVEGYLAMAGISVPMDAAVYGALPESTKALLQQWTATVAGYQIQAWRGTLDKENVFERMYLAAREQMATLAKGMRLSGLSPASRVAFGSGMDADDPSDQLEALRHDGWDW